MEQDGLKRYVEFVHAGGSIKRVLLRDNYRPESELPSDVCYYSYVDSYSISGPAENRGKSIYVGRVISRDEVSVEFPDAEGLLETMKESRLPSVLLTADGHFRKITDGMSIVNKGKSGTGNL